MDIFDLSIIEITAILGAVTGTIAFVISTTLAVLKIKDRRLSFKITSLYREIFKQNDGISKLVICVSNASPQFAGIHGISLVDQNNTVHDVEFRKYPDFGIANSKSLSGDLGEHKVSLTMRSSHDMSFTDLPMTNLNPWESKVLILEIKMPSTSIIKKVKIHNSKYRKPKTIRVTELPITSEIRQTLHS